MSIGSTDVNFPNVNYPITNASDTDSTTVNAAASQDLQDEILNEEIAEQKEKDKELNQQADLTQQTLHRRLRNKKSYLISFPHRLKCGELSAQIKSLQV